MLMPRAPLTPCSLFQIVFVPSIYLFIYFSAFFSFLFGSSRMTRIFFSLASFQKTQSSMKTFGSNNPMGFFLPGVRCPLDESLIQLDTIGYNAIQFICAGVAVFFFRTPGASNLEPSCLILFAQKLGANWKSTKTSSFWNSNQMFFSCGTSCSLGSLKSHKPLIQPELIRLDVLPIVSIKQLLNFSSQHLLVALH